MVKQGEDLGTKLDWVAVDHHNTGQRKVNPSSSVPDADMIFGVIERLIADGATDERASTRRDPRPRCASLCSR